LAFSIGRDVVRASHNIETVRLQEQHCPLGALEVVASDIAHEPIYGAAPT